MSSFTMPLKSVIKRVGATANIDDTTGIRVISLADAKKIGLGWYPITDEAHRTRLNGMILDHYWNREIGYETIELFMLGMRRKLNEEMPYFNQIYASTQVDYDPLSTIDLHTVNAGTSNTTGTTTGEATSTSDQTSHSRNVQQETPQTQLSGSGDYASAAADANAQSNVTGDSTNTGNSTSEESNSVDSTVSGFQGIAAELIMRYRESLINVDLMVINAIADQFMSVWNTGDSYTHNYGWN